VNVLNPQSRDIKVLDEALNSGAVHYPGTGSLTEDANVFIFGHSSFLPNVINKNASNVQLQRGNWPIEVKLDVNRLRFQLPFPGTG